MRNFKDFQVSDYGGLYENKKYTLTLKIMFLVYSPQKNKLCGRKTWSINHCIKMEFSIYAASLVVMLKYLGYTEYLKWEFVIYSDNRMGVETTRSVSLNSFRIKNT